MGTLDTARPENAIMTISLGVLGSYWRTLSSLGAARSAASMFAHFRFCRNNHFCDERFYWRAVPLPVLGVTGMEDPYLQTCLLELQKSEIAYAWSYVCIRRSFT
jgi:hypothetical protein